MDVVSAVLLLTIDCTERDQEHSGEGHEDEKRGADAVELTGISGEESEPNEDEEEMGAEDLERGLAEGEEGLDADDALDHGARSVEEESEGSEVEQAERADLPLVELHAEELRREVRPEPAVAHSKEEDADGRAEEIERAGKSGKGPPASGDEGAKAKAEDPDQLPGKEVKGSSLLQGDVEVRCSDGKIVDPGPHTELGEQPDGAAGGEDPAPTLFCGEDKQGRRGEHENDVDGKDIEQRWAVDQQQRGDDGRERMREVVVQQVGERGAMSVRGYRRRNGEGEQQHEEVVAVDAKAALPYLLAHLLWLFSGAADGEHGQEKAGEKDEAFGGGDKAEGLIEVFAQAGGKVVQGHPDEEEAAQSVELGPAGRDCGGRDRGLNWFGHRRRCSYL